MAEKSLSKAFEPHESEARWYGYWLECDFFRAADTSPKPPYCFSNVTAAQHGCLTTCRSDQVQE